MLNDHCHRVSTHLQSINIIIIIIIIIIKRHLLPLICNFFVPCIQPLSSKQLSESRHILLKHPVKTVMLIVYYPIS